MNSITKFKRLLACAIVLILAQPAKGEVKTVTSTIRQMFGDDQSPVQARTAALAQAKRAALEMAGTYIESLTLVKDHAVERDQVLALTAAVTRTEIVSQKNFATEEAFGVVVTARIDVDTDVLEQRIAKLMGDRSLLEKYEESLKREKELVAQIQELQARNLSLKRPSPEQAARLKVDFGRTSRRLEAVELNRSVLAHFGHQSFEKVDETVAVLEKVINLDPSYAAAYNNLGIAFYQQGEFDKALESLRKSEQLMSEESGKENPKLATVWTSLGAAYNEKGDYDDALLYYRKVLALGADRLEAETAVALCINLGNTYYLKGESDSCLYYHQKAVSVGRERLGPRHKLVGAAYHYAGTAFLDQGRLDLALVYLKMALNIGLETLGPGHFDLAKVYAGLGRAHAQNEDTRGAEGCLALAVDISSRHVGVDHRITVSYRKLLESLKSGALAGVQNVPEGYQPRAQAGSWRELSVWRKLRRGMTTQQVMSILGRPRKKVSSGAVDQWLYGRLKGDRRGTNLLVGKVTFSAGRLRSWEEP